MEDLTMKKRFVDFGVKASLLLLLVSVSIVWVSCAVMQKMGISSKPSKQATAAHRFGKRE